MSTWREVQEALYRVWKDGWADTTRYAFANEAFDPQKEQWVRLRVMTRPGAQETLGRPGNRKMGRRGVVYALLREPPGKGAGGLSDLAGKAKGLFEAQRFEPFNIRFGAGDIGPEGDVDAGRWWGVTVECPFDFEEII